ncbi:hypothetical protein, partial [Aneurinibacillus aneurinilyticus]|uniref:hypothetical protein n=1 Tax=Aneurinibacillus aneurinilyticus TaxID=1391 RepID=UPI002E23D674|nr:hypothetical protein [Aneurinibacillus aneurinilyticus]
MIIQYDPEWVVTTPCPKRASVRLPHGSIEGRFLPQPGGIAKHLGNAKRETVAVLFRLAGACARRGRRKAL